MELIQSAGKTSCKIKIELAGAPGCGKSSALSKLKEIYKTDLLITGEKLYTSYDLAEVYSDKQRNYVVFQTLLMERYLREQQKVTKENNNRDHIIAEHTTLETIAAFNRALAETGEISQYNYNFLQGKEREVREKMKDINKNYITEKIFWKVKGETCQQNMEKRKRNKEGKIEADVLNSVCETIGKKRDEGLSLEYEEGNFQVNKIQELIESLLFTSDTAFLFE